MPTPYAVFDPAQSLHGKRVLIRQDLNTPIKFGKITSDARIKASIPTIQSAMHAGAQVLLMSHLGRPKEGAFDPDASLAPIAAHLSETLGANVRLVDDYLTRAPTVKDGEVVLLENVRFNLGEKDNDTALAKKYAALCDLYVMDAFAVAHRKHASTYGAGEWARARCAGPLLDAELQSLAHAWRTPERPLVAVVGGEKVSSKLKVLARLSETVDALMPGGGIANTFLAAAGYNIGKSLYEEKLLSTAKNLMRNERVYLPVDVVVAKALHKDSRAANKTLDEVADDDMILDIGEQTIARYSRLLAAARTIVWSGPLGVFELPQFAAGSKLVGRAIAASRAYSIAGGGDTLAAIEKFNLNDAHAKEKISRVSTGGGAFLAFLEGVPLPAVEMLTAS